VKAPARAGALAPLDVVVPKQATPLGPEKTSFFQALQITTKITKGCIEILVCAFISHSARISVRIRGGHRFLGTG